MNQGDAETEGQGGRKEELGLWGAEQGEQADAAAPTAGVPQTKAEEMPGERQCDRSPPPRRPRPCGSPRCRRGSAGAASPLWLTTEAAGPQGCPPPRDTPEGVRVREGLSLPIRSQGGECWRRPVMRRLGVTPTAPCLLFLRECPSSWGPRVGPRRLQRLQGLHPGGIRTPARDQQDPCPAGKVAPAATARSPARGIR